MLTYILDVWLKFCLKATTALLDLVVKGLLLTRVPRLVHLPDILSSMSLVTWTFPWL